MKGSISLGDVGRTARISASRVLQDLRLHSAQNSKARFRQRVRVKVFLGNSSHTWHLNKSKVPSTPDLVVFAEQESLKETLQTLRAARNRGAGEHGEIKTNASDTGYQVG